MPSPEPTPQPSRLDRLEAKVDLLLELMATLAAAMQGDEVDDPGEDLDGNPNGRERDQDEPL